MSSGVEAIGDPFSTREACGGDTDGVLGQGDVGGFRFSYLKEKKYPESLQ